MSFLFSVMWLFDLSDISLVDKPSSSFKLVHWNCISNGARTEFHVWTAPKKKRRVGEKSFNVVPEVSNEKSLDSLDKTQCRCHDEDKGLYPKNYKFWRYLFNRQHEISNWTPYFALTKEEKWIVDLKHAPLINLVVWKQWPSSIVDCDSKYPTV